jgi:dsDNA-specific endonuclease/ATPase MutS2
METMNKTNLNIEEALEMASVILRRWNIPSSMPKTDLANLLLREVRRAEDKLYDEVIAKLEADLDETRELLAEAYIKLSGRKEHHSDCATSCAPAKRPGPCDCGIKPEKK